MKEISPRLVVKQKGRVAPANEKGKQKAKDVRLFASSRTSPAEAMKDDLSQFDFGSMGEVLLSATIADQARLQERVLVLDLWRQSVIQEDITTWLADLHNRTRCRWANFAQVGATARAGPGSHRPLPTKPVTPEHGAPAPVPNTLPPPFFFSAPELFYIQNFLQAVVIAAALRALLLTSENGAEGARLINLADELVRASSLVDDEAGKLRAAARTVRATDPVFLLLQRRLLSTLAERLARAPTAPIHRKDAPTEMRTGRREQTTFNVTSEERTEVEGLDVKGFGDPVLTGAIEEGLKKLRTAVRWIEDVEPPTGNGLELTEVGYSPFTQNALIFIAAALGSGTGIYDECDR
ncbi:hypothetical protein EDB84DRAFT_1679608 [Lactarius hengduanensis]|nr:hypothetical protein EDB84DRAFT_1679608 [Lactarius hengduanensis]